MRDGQTSVADIIAAVAGSAVVAAVMLAGVMRIASAAQTFGPVPGDIVAFAPGTRLEQTDLRVAAAIPRHDMLCLLEAREIAMTGGSLIVEARAGDDYHVHWAGPRSSGGSADCGRARDLVITRADLVSLAVAAGGFGALSKAPVPLPGVTETASYLP